MMRLHLSDIKLKDNTFHWKLNNYPFKINYNFPVDGNSIPIMKLMPIIHLSCLISSLKNVATVTTDFNLSLPEKLFIHEYVRQLHPVNINYLDTHSSKMRFPYVFTINGEDFTGDEYSHSYKQLKDLNMSEPLKYEKDVVCAWSGGKDSLLSILLLLEIGCNVLPGTTKWNTIAFNRGAAPYMEAHAIKPFYVAKLALGNKMKKLTNEVIMSEKSNEKIKLDLKAEFKGDVVLPMALYHPFYMQTQLINNLVYALYKDVRYVFAGDEYGVNGGGIFGQHYIDNIGQSNNGKKLINAYTTSFYKRAPVAYSILYPLHGAAEVYLLINRYNRKDFTSCLTMIGKYCNRCVKCAISFLVLQGIGKNPEEYGMNKKKLIKEFKKLDRYSLLVPPEDERMWMVKRNFHDQELKKIINSFADGITEDSMLNPLLPEEKEYNTIPKAYRSQIIEIYNSLTT